MEAQHHPPQNLNSPNDKEYGDVLILKPIVWAIRAMVMQAESIATTFFGLFSMLCDSLQRAEEATETTVEPVQDIPTRAAVALRKVGLGFIGAAYVGMVLVVVLAVAAVVGIGVVRVWVEEPVFVREPLHFDYTQAHPSALLSFKGMQGKKTAESVILVGHTLFVSIVLVMPESDFNRQAGVFQLTAEVISPTGDIIKTSSQPCMLRFRSLPVRLMRTFVMGIPVLMGIFSETQEIKVEILKYKEGNPRTEAIRVRLKPRAGTTGLPQLYAAEIIINSQLPWRKELVHSWKWTFYIWTSLYTYLMLLIVLFCCCKRTVFPLMSFGDQNQRDASAKAVRDEQSGVGGNGVASDEPSGAFRKWHQSRRNRRAWIFRTSALQEAVGTSASCITRDELREEASEVVGETGEWTVSDSEYESC